MAATGRFSVRGCAILKAEAVVLDDGVTQVALVGLDLLGIHNSIA